MPPEDAPANSNTTRDGTDRNFNADSYTVNAYTDAYAGAVIPLSSVDAHAYVTQTNTITVYGDARVNTGGSANLITNYNVPSRAVAQATSSSWVSDFANAINSLTGGDPSKEFNGTAKASQSGSISVDGAIHTGIDRNIDVTFSYANSQPTYGTTNLAQTDVQTVHHGDTVLLAANYDEATYIVGAGTTNTTVDPGNVVNDAGTLYRYIGSTALAGVDFSNGAQPPNFSSADWVKISGFNGDVYQYLGSSSASLDLNNQDYANTKLWTDVSANATIVSSNPNVQFTDRVETESSGLVTSYGQIQTQLASYQNIQSQIGGPGKNSTIDQQIAFDQEEISAIQTQLVAQGLGKFESNETSGGTTFIVVQRTVQVIDVAPIRAQAGQIYLFGSQVQGTGVLDAPIGVNVTITNDTLSTLQIEGIDIPQNIGGIYVDGVLLDGATVAADNTAINNQNAVGGAAHFSDITLAQPPAAPTTSGQPNAFVTITNLQQFLSADQIAGGVTQPDIIVNGAIYAPFAALIIVSHHDFNKTSTGQIDVYSQNILATNNVTIDEVQFYASGDPASQILGTPANGETVLDGSVAAATTAIQTYQQTPQVAVNPTTGAALVAQTIEIQAEYVDLNGTIVAGQAQETLTIDPGTLSDPGSILSQIQTIKNEKLATPQLLHLSAADNSYDDFAVYYDPSTNSIEVQPVALSGGVLTIKGHIASTSVANLDAFGYYGNVNITNNTTYKLVVDGVDASQHGAGQVDITDLNKTSGSNVLETKYLSTQGGGMSVSTNYVDPATGVAAGAGSVINESANSTQYKPEAGLRYNFSVEFGTETVTTSTYYESNWIGVFNLGDGTLVGPPVTTTIQGPNIVASSLYYYVDTAHETTPYLFNSTTIKTGDSGQVPGANWKTSTWYGKNTYYQQYTDTTFDTTISDTSIQADLPVNIDFTGGSTANITINSPYSSVELLGNLANVTGTTSVTAGGAITAPVPNTTVEGVKVALTAGSGIGVDGQPVDVVLAGTSGQSLTAATTDGPIYIAAPLGAIAVDSITAGGDKAVNLTSHGDITVAAGGAGLITGGNVAIVSGGAVGASGAPIKLAVGQEAADQLSLTATGDVFVEQTTGNLPLFALTTSGDAYVTVDNGSVVNVNTNITQDPRTVAELLAGPWTALQLTSDTGAQAKITATLTEYQISQEAQYQTYWADRNSLIDPATGKPTDITNPNAIVALSAATLSYYTDTYTTQGQQQGLSGSALTDFVNNAIQTLELSATQQYYNLAAIFGPGGSYAPGVANVYDPSTITNNDPSTGTTYDSASAPAYDPNTQDPNFTYLLTETEKTNLIGNIKVWTQSELLSGISAGLLQTTTSTQVNIEQPNITAKNIVITAKKGSSSAGGNIGSIVNPVTNFSPTADVIGFEPGHSIDGTPVQLALAAAQLADLNFLAAVPLTETVNFSGDTMTLTNGTNWSATGLSIQAGDWLYHRRQHGRTRPRTAPICRSPRRGQRLDDHLHPAGGQRSRARRSLSPRW